MTNVNLGHNIATELDLGSNDAPRFSHYNNIIQEEAKTLDLLEPYAITMCALTLLRMRRVPE